MAKIFKRLNALQIVSIIGMIITSILSFLNVFNMENLFYIFVGLNIGGLTLFMDKWTKEGIINFKKMDKKYSKNYTWKSSDMILGVIVIYVIAFCILYLVNFFISFVKVTVVIIILMSIIVDLITLYIVDYTSKQVKEVIKNDRNDTKKWEYPSQNLLSLCHENSGDFI